MFNGCTAFNQALNFTNTNTISNMSGMLNGCNLFKQNISAWVVTSCGNFSSFYAGDLNDPDSATNQDNYDALLSAWSLQALLFGLTLDMGSTKYSAATAAARAILTGTYGWTINDGGMA